MQKKKETKQAAEKPDVDDLIFGTEEIGCSER